MTPEATPLGFVIGPTSKPNPPEFGSLLKLFPANTNVSSTVKVSVLRIVCVPSTVKLPVIVAFPAMVALPLTARLLSPGSEPVNPTLNAFTSA